MDKTKERKALIFNTKIIVAANALRRAEDTRLNLMDDLESANINCDELRNKYSEALNALVDYKAEVLAEMRDWLQKHFGSN